MRIKQPKMLFPAGNEKRPRQDIPTEAARLKARMARTPPKAREDMAPAKADPKPKS
jgi:hypothetical protein